MDKESYQVILEGRIRTGFERSQVVKNLASLFKQDAEVVERLLSGDPKILKSGLNRQTALRYQQAVEQAGAASRIEAGQEQKDLTGTPVSGRPVKEAGGIPEARGPVCPRCGYEPSRPDDVMLVRGDCPRCGLLVQKDAPMADSTLSQRVTESDAKSALTELYEERDPASWERRAYAATYTFSLFLFVHCVLVLAFIFLFYPLELLHVHVGRDFIDIARADYPMLIAALSILVVSFGMPLMLGGRSWGQKNFGIKVQFTEETGTGGILLAMAFRVATVLLVTYGPGLIMLRIATEIGYEASISSKPGTMIIMALVAWCAVWLVGPLRADKRGLLDLAAGSVQTDDGLVPLNPLRRALEPMAAVVGFLLVVGLITPLFFR